MTLLHAQKKAFEVDPTKFKEENLGLECKNFSVNNLTIDIQPENVTDLSDPGQIHFFDETFPS